MQRSRNIVARQSTKHNQIQKRVIQKIFIVTAFVNSLFFFAKLVLKYRARADYVELQRQTTHPYKVLTEQASWAIHLASFITTREGLQVLIPRRDDPKVHENTIQWAWKGVVGKYHL